MAPLGCHSSESAMRLCKDSFLASNPPSIDSASGRSSLNVLKHVSITHLSDFSLGKALNPVVKGFGQGIAKTPYELAKREVTITNTDYSGGNPSPDHNKEASNKSSPHMSNQMVMGLIFGPLAFLVVLSIVSFCIRGGPRYNRPLSKKSNHDWEYRSQDRVNKSLRWKTLKKDGPGQENGAGEGAGGEKRAADVEALEGVKITPLKVWSITSHPSTDSIPPREKTWWEKLRSMWLGWERS